MTARLSRLENEPQTSDTTTTTSCNLVYITNGGYTVIVNGTLIAGKSVLRTQMKPLIAVFSILCTFAAASLSLYLVAVEVSSKLLSQEDDR